MAATHEVAPDALPFSDQEYEQLSMSNSNFAALVCKLSYLHTKDQFKWFGNFEELICLVKILLETNDTGEFSEDQTHKMLTFRVGDIFVEWYSTTHMLQTQGSGFASLRTKLMKVYSSKDELVALQVNNSSDSNVPSVELANSKEPSAAAVFDISSNESSPLASCGCCSTVNSDLKNLENQFNDFQNQILSKLNMQASLSHDERVQPKREADVQLINTLRQKNEDLNNEISILKELLHEEEAKRGKISEERDSYKIALQVLTKEFNTAEFNSPSSTHDQPDDNYVEPGKNHGPNSKTKKTKQSKGQKFDSQTPKTGQKIQQTPVNFTNRLAPLGHEDKDSIQNASSSDNSNFTTVLVGDSIIKQIQGWKLGKKVGHRVVVKSFSGATTSDMKHYLKPTLEKNPQQILLHVGTNDLRDQNPNVVVDNVVELARKIESETNARIILSELVARSDNVSSDSVKTVNRKLKKFCNQNNWKLVQHQNITTNDLNQSGLHLNNRGNNILFNNFVNCLDNRSA